MVTTTPLEPSASNAEVLRIREHLNLGRFGEALAAAGDLLRQAPAHRDALYMAAVSQRYLNRIPQALATLDLLQKHHPRYSRLYQERGHCHVANRSAPSAIEAFAQAVHLNQALPASWKALQLLFRIEGDASRADNAGRHLATLQSLPVEIVTATSMLNDDEIEAAEALVRGYLLSHGDHVEAMRLLATIGMRLDVTDDAELLLENVLILSPHYHAARYQYAVVLLQRHKHERAREEMEKLLEVEPDNPLYRTNHAAVLAGLGDHDRAIPAYRAVLADMPRDPDLHLSLAHALKTVGRQSEAIDAYRQAASLRRGYGDAYWSLANLKTYRFEDAEISTMRDEEAMPMAELNDRFHLCFALGKALEDRGEYAESFAYYQRGNELKKSTSRYRPEPLERSARLQMSPVRS